MTPEKRRLHVMVIHTTSMVLWFREYGVLMMILNPFHILSVSPKHLPKTKMRSVDSPTSVLEVYHKSKRQGPSHTSDQRAKHEHSTNEHLQSKPSLNRAYCVSKPQQVDGHILPGWPRYNTLLNSTTILPYQTGIPSSDTCQPNKNGYCLHHFKGKCCYAYACLCLCLFCYV